MWRDHPFVGRRIAPGNFWNDATIDHAISSVEFVPALRRQSDFTTPKINAAHFAIGRILQAKPSVADRWQRRSRKADLAELQRQTWQQLKKRGLRERGPKADHCNNDNGCDVTNSRRARIRFCNSAVLSGHPLSL